MQNVISRRYAITAIIIALTAGAHAQGPAPSPLISLPSPPPAKVPTVAAQPSPAPLFTRQDFETFLDALIPSQLQNRDSAGDVTVLQLRRNQRVQKRVTATPISP